MSSRSFPGETVNGDRWLVQERAGGLRLAIVDGLGHGPDAATAATAAISSLEAEPDLDPATAVLACDAYLRGTRGAGASVLLLEAGRATFAGVGNVEARIITPAREQRLSPDRGTLGRGIRRPHALETSLGEVWLAMLHSDGIASRFDVSLAAEATDIDELARSILNEFARPTDDATIVIARGP